MAPCGDVKMEHPAPDSVLHSFGLPYFRELAIFTRLSDKVIVDMLRGGSLDQLEKGEHITRVNEKANDFQILLQGRLAYYKHCEDHHVLTRYFYQGEQLGFDEMIGLIERNGTDVAAEDSPDSECQQYAVLPVAQIFSW